MKPQKYVKQPVTVEAMLWDEGYVAGANADLEDWENAPSLIENPYRTEEK